MTVNDSSPLPSEKTQSSLDSDVGPKCNPIIINDEKVYRRIHDRLNVSEYNLRVLG